MARNETDLIPVERHLRRRRRRGLIVAGLLIVGLLILSQIVRFTENSAREHTNSVEHFKYGSIGSEIPPSGGMPYWIWRALPRLFAEELGGKGWEKFGFLYDETRPEEERELPVGVSKRRYQGIDLVWLNCAVCHTGTYREAPEGERVIVPAMPSNNLDFHGFVNFIFNSAADERFSNNRMMAEIEALGADLSLVERLLYRLLVIPETRDGLLQRRHRLGRVIAQQPPWGPGRVDTFNPYKALIFNYDMTRLPKRELIGTSDFPAIFLQGPREGMQLHWDGNNPSLQERNLSAALGAGVNPTTVDHDAIGRVALWLKTLESPPHPQRSQLDQELAARGQKIYLRECADCHGYASDAGYRFEGERLGKVEPIENVGTDPKRLDSYTQELMANQYTLFAADPKWHFQHFRKTNGYANAPLDGLWLRGPYLHNGSVPSVWALLLPPGQRPKTFTRDTDVVDLTNGGYIYTSCDPATHKDGFCFDTSLPGNSNSGHRYGTLLNWEEKRALLEYLKTF